MGQGAIYLWNLPKITGVADLATHLHLSPNIVRRLVLFSSRFYRTVTIPKHNGGSRVLHCPGRTLKAVQRWILRNILEKVTIEESAAAYYNGASPVTNAKRHAENVFFVKLDLEDFFPSIKEYRVYTVFRALGYDSQVSYLLKEICTLNGRLPQGAPTSPALSNIICKRLDRRLAKLAGNRHVVYSRYADDITFSAKTPERVQRCKLLAQRIVTDEGFTLNGRKTRVIGKRRLPVVTGIAIADKGLVRVTRIFKRRVRAAVFRLTLENNPDRKIEIEAHVNGL